MRTCIKWLVIIVVGSLFLLLVAASRTSLGELVRRLPFGWVSFLKRHCAEMTVNWVTVVTGLVLVTVVLCGGHLLLGTLYRQARQQLDSNSERRPWPWRWTVSLFVSLGMLFAVAFGATGVFRQTSWLLQFEGNWYEVRKSPFNEMKMLHLSITMAAEEGDVDDTKKIVQSESWRGNQIFEDYSIIYYAQTNRKYAGFIIIPRTARLLKYGKFASSATPDLFQPLSELEATIRSFDQKYPIKR